MVNPKYGKRTVHIQYMILVSHGFVNRHSHVSLYILKEKILTCLILKVVPIKRRRIRVLSLFDGIASGLLVLENHLKLEIEVYFSSEIDQNALNLQSERWGGKIVQLGDVKCLSEDLISALGRIDLLIGGSVLLVLFDASDACLPIKQDCNHFICCRKSM